MEDYQQEQEEEVHPQLVLELVFQVEPQPSPDQALDLPHTAPLQYCNIDLQEPFLD